MNLQTYFNKSATSLQAISQLWNKEIASLLPDDLENIAKQSNAFERKRSIHSSLDLLKAFLLYGVCNISFSMLSLAMASLDICNISDTAWRKDRYYFYT